jgi:hypothetical protein
MEIMVNDFQTIPLEIMEDPAWISLSGRSWPSCKDTQAAQWKVSHGEELSPPANNPH